MKHLIAAASIAFSAPVFAQPALGPTDPVMPAPAFSSTNVERTQVAAGEGATVRDGHASAGSSSAAPLAADGRHVEHRNGYFDPSR